MELTSEPDYIEKPVIDIEVEFAGGNAERDMMWTVNDVPETAFTLEPDYVSFKPTPDEFVLVELRNVDWVRIRRRIDRIPVPPAPTEQK